MVPVLEGEAELGKRVEVVPGRLRGKEAQTG